ncbi:MAG: hypothetical protein E3J86_11480 [Candidatus Thorarchaeota archaeon]|nr:MAG: hypothetical protein E3J86_11480 [Candidatus Thorarchaeota archaeon]
MSDIDQVIERNIEELRGLGTPTIQRVYWAIGSVVGAIAVFGILFPFIEVLRFEFLQLILISFSAALIIAVISFRPRTREINWSQILAELAKRRIHIESIMDDTHYILGGSSPSKEDEELVKQVLKITKMTITRIREFYRLALLEGKSDLANDFQVEIKELGGWLKPLEKLLTPSK